MRTPVTSVSKLFQQLQCLSDIEVKRFRNVIKKDHTGERSAILAMLLRALKNGQPEPDKEEVYTRVFKDSYSRQKDYIIRNEYRLISEDLEQFLASAPADTRSLQYLKLNYLGRLLQAGAYHLFLIEKKALLKQFPHASFLQKEILRMESDFFARHKLSKRNAIEEYRGLIHTLKEQTRADAILSASEIYIREAFIYRTLKGYDIAPVLPQIPLFNEVPAEVEADVAYNLLKARQYLEMGEEKIATLRRMQKELKKCRQKPPSELYFPSATIGLELMIIGRYKEAVAEFTHTLSLPGYAESELFRIGGIFNHLSALAKAGSFREFEEMYASFRSLLQAHPYLFRLELIRSVVLLNLNEFRKAKALVRDFKMEDKSSDSFYLRVLFTCCYLGEGDLVAAAYELENLQRALRGGGATEPYHYAAQVLRAALRWSQKPSEASLAKLRVLLEQGNADPSQELETLPVKWIARYAGLSA